jgi:CheY-like chemotaxis protein/HPt (histidine-containing phosphotransfer) domain-containing protein
MSANISSSQPGQPLSLLVVDDDELNRRMMQVILKREGHQVECVANGLEALNAVKGAMYDIVLMDLQMPVMDGMEASRLIREWEQGRAHTFIVALTASYMPEKGRELYEIGIDNYLSKPFEIEHLRHILQYGMENRKKVPVAQPEVAETRQADFDDQIGLQRVGGDLETYLELLTDFVREMPIKLEVARTAIQARDLEALQRAAHNMKGVSANLGVLQLSEHARGLEKVVTEGYTDSLEMCFSDFVAVADRAIGKIHQFLSVKGINAGGS